MLEPQQTTPPPVVRAQVWEQPAVEPPRRHSPAPIRLWASRCRRCPSPSWPLKVGTAPARDASAGRQRARVLPPGCDGRPRRRRGICEGARQGARLGVVVRHQTSTAPAACGGVTAVIVVALATRHRCRRPADVTAAPARNPVPSIVTAVPPAGGPVNGETAVTAGAGAPPSRPITVVGVSRGPEVGRRVARGVVAPALQAAACRQGTGVVSPAATVVTPPARSHRHPSGVPCFCLRAVAQLTGASIAPTLHSSAVVTAQVWSESPNLALDATGKPNTAVGVQLFVVASSPTGPSRLDSSTSPRRPPSPRTRVTNHRRRPPRRSSGRRRPSASSVGLPCRRPAGRMTRVPSTSARRPSSRRRCVDQPASRAATPLASPTTGVGVSGPSSCRSRAGPE